MGKALAPLLAITVAGCSIHPIVDDVSPLPSEAIVATARCEVRLALEEKYAVWYRDEGIDINRFKPYRAMEDWTKIKQAYKLDDISSWEDYFNISIAYEWTFDIVESDLADASVGFGMPFIPSGSFGVAAGGKINTQRQGKRTFKNQDTLGSLLTQGWYDYCHDKDLASDGIIKQPIPQPERILYPITGSIGLDRVILTFLNISMQEGGVDTFTDEITFTTTLDAKLGSAIALSPVTDRLRLISASANLGGNRVDLHKVKIGLAFPKARPAQKTTKPLDKGANIAREEAKGGYSLNPSWRAYYALCVADARSREDDLKLLRLEPPEVTCIRTADAFFPRGNGVTSSLATGRHTDLVEEKRVERERKVQGGEQKPQERQKTRPPT